MNEMLHKLKIGNVEIKNNLILAPMAGVTDLAFRILCKEQGCGLLYTEMVSAKAILYKNKNTRVLLAVSEKERPISLQLFGSDPAIMGEIAAQLEEGPYDLFDVNMGCPVPKIVNNKEGSALIKDPKLAASIVEAMTKKIKKPVTVKIRKGFDGEKDNASEFAKYLEAAGAAAIAVHGRTREQYYSGEADISCIRKVKESVSIPVIGNGDITSPEKAREMLIQTGCDALMIGRGARGNPWIFSQIKEYLESGRYSSHPPIEQVKHMIQRHAELLVKYKGEYTGMREMRKHVAWYTAGYPHSSKLRNLVNEIETYEELNKLLEQFKAIGKIEDREKV